MKKRFAVIGHPISHSLSPKIHQLFARQLNIDLQYETLLGDLERFELQVSTFFAEGGKGLNVTLPFKQRAYALASVATPRARKAQAANTLWMDKGLLHADNTDGVGFIRDIERFNTLSDKTILLLGAGGAARGIIGPILECKPRALVVFNRTEQKLIDLKRDFPEIEFELQGAIDVLINATASSLSGDEAFFPDVTAHQKPFCYDLAYQLQSPTLFVSEARRQGCSAADGLGMLVEQAAEAFYIWHGVRPQGSVDISTILAKTG